MILIPGTVLFNWLKLKTTFLTAISLILSLGFVSTIILAKFSRWLKIEVIFFCWLAFTFIRFWPLLLKGRLEFIEVRFSRPFLFGIFFLFLSFFIILLIDNFPNGRLLPSGDLALRMRFYDGFLRIAVTHELSHSFPPQLPFAAGYPLNYHYGMDLFFSLFVRYGHLNVFDVNHRLGLTFLAFLLFLNLIVFLRSFLRADSLTLFGTFYLIFGSGGLAYIFCSLFQAPFTGNIFLNFYFHDLISLNSLLPALAIFFVALTCFDEYEKEGRTGWLIAASLFLATLFEFKVFLIVPVATSLLSATGWQFIIHKKKNLIPLTILTGLFSLPLFLTALLSSKNFMGYRFTLKPIDWITHVLRELHLTRWSKIWSAFISGNPNGLYAFIIILVIIIIYLIGAFGLTLLAWPRVLKAIFESSGLQSFLSCFSLISVAYFFFFNWSLGRLSRNLLNIYVFYAGLIGLSLFFLLNLREFLSKYNPFKKVIILTLLCLLSIPNTGFYLASRIKRPETRIFSHSFVAAANWVQKNIEPEAIILHPTDMRYICYLAGRRVVLDNSIHSYLDFHLPRVKIRERIADVDRFFHDPENNLDVLLKYEVNYIWIDKERGLKLLALDQQGADEPFNFFSRLASENYHIYFKLIFANEDHLIYKIERQ